MTKKAKPRKVSTGNASHSASMKRWRLVKKGVLPDNTPTTNIEEAVKAAGIAPEQEKSSG